MAKSTREINYHFGATENVTAVTDKVNAALKKTQAAGQRAGAQPGGIGGFLKGAKQQAEASGLAGENSIGTLLRGGGAAILTRELGQALQGVPEAARQFREALKTGATRVEAGAALVAEALPVVGELAKGLASLRDEFNGENKKFFDAEQKRADKAIEDARKQRTAERRGTFAKEVNDSSRREIDEAFLAPLDGTRRARLAAKQELERSLKEISDLEKQVGSQGDERAQNELRTKLAQRRSAANVKFREEERRLLQQDEQRRAQLLATARAAELVNLGQDLAAETELRRAALNQQIEDLRRQGATEEDINIARRRAEAEQLAANERDRVAKQGKRFSFAEMGIGFLEREVELGKGALRLDVERLKISEDFTRQRAELDDLLAKENLDANQRRLLTGLRGQLDRQEQAALENIGKPRFSGGVAPGGEDRFGTGVVAAGRENDPANKIVAATKENGETLKNIRDTLNDIKKNTAGNRPSSPLGLN
ncbi:MAG TPA: hypothetical protein VGE74_17890 [Gemmata sp.]